MAAGPFVTERAHVVEFSRAYIGWYATLEDYDGPPAPVGWGGTQLAALESLLWTVEEDCE